MSVRILRIIARLNIGGPARNAVLLAEGISDTVLVCGEVAGREGDMMYLAREKGIEPVIVKELGRELSPADDFRAFWKIYKLICTEKPDIIHTHTAKAGALGRLAGILYNFRLNGKVRLVHTFHGHVLHSYFGRVKTCFFIWIEKILALSTDTIISISGTLKKELVGSFRIAPEQKISVVELGFELDKLLKLPLKEESDCINIGIVGRLVPVKNHKMVLDCAHRVNSDVRSNDIRLVVVGDGELRGELENYVRKLRIEDIVEFRGWVKDVAEIYRDLDILVLTSLNEGTPVSIIEAMAAARPVVATDVGGVRDVVQDGKSGYLVEPGDDEGFREKLLDLIKDTKIRKAFGQYGREFVKNRFSKERLIKDMDRLYDILINNKTKLTAADQNLNYG